MYAKHIWQTRWDSSTQTENAGLWKFFTKKTSMLPKVSRRLKVLSENIKYKVSYGRRRNYYKRKVDSPIFSAELTIRICLGKCRKRNELCFHPIKFTERELNIDVATDLISFCKRFDFVICFSEIKLRVS